MELTRDPRGAELEVAEHNVLVPQVAAVVVAVAQGGLGYAVTGAGADDLIVCAVNRRNCEKHHGMKKEQAWSTISPADSWSIITLAETN